MNLIYRTHGRRSVSKRLAYVQANFKDGAEADLFPAFVRLLAALFETDVAGLHRSRRQKLEKVIPWLWREFSYAARVFLPKIDRSWEHTPLLRRGQEVLTGMLPALPELRVWLEAGRPYCLEPYKHGGVLITGDLNASVDLGQIGFRTALDHASEWHHQMAQVKANAGTGKTFSLPDRKFAFTNKLHEWPDGSWLAHILPAEDYHNCDDPQTRLLMQVGKKLGHCLKEAEMAQEALLMSSVLVAFSANHSPLWTAVCSSFQCNSVRSGVTVVDELRGKANVFPQPRYWPMMEEIFYYPDGSPVDFTELPPHLHVKKLSGKWRGWGPNGVMTMGQNTREAAIAETWANGSIDFKLRRPIGEKLGC